MNQRTHLLIVIAAIVLVVAILAVALAQCSAQPVPATETPGATTATMASIAAPTEEPSAPAVTPGPTSTPTEGEKAAAAVGQEYIAYRGTQAECEQAVKNKDVEACVWPDSTQLIVRPEWEQVLPDTDFYLLDLAGYDEVYGHDHRLRLAAAHSGHYYTAETFDCLLQDNGITAITDENYELVAKVFALMTIPEYLEGNIEFMAWEVFEEIPIDNAYSLTAWTQIQGLELRWDFVFGNGQLLMAMGPKTLQEATGDYIRVSEFELVPPASKVYEFPGE